jgi:hypothetical protein
MPPQPGLDPGSAEWLRVLADPGPPREAALARLHEMLVRIARTEVGRRAPRPRLTGPELDDLARAVTTSTACWPPCTTKPPDRFRLSPGRGKNSRGCRR